MSELTIYAENDAGTPLLKTGDFDEIRRRLGEAGIRIDRWQADRELPDDADSDTIIAAYQAEIDRVLQVHSQAHLGADPIAAAEMYTDDVKIMYNAVEVNFKSSMVDG